MTEWASIRRFVAVIALLSVVALPSLAADPLSPKPRYAKPTSKLTPDQLRELATKAEQSGDWEAAFNAYCHLFVSDRSSPNLREKLNTTLRRVQQLRRHRDPGFQQFATGMQFTESLELFDEVFRKVPAVYADREKATPQNLWVYAIEEFNRALGNPTFRRAFLDNPEAEKIEQFRATLRDYWAKRDVKDHKTARETMRELIAKGRDDAFTTRFPAALVIECACGACSGLDEYTIFLTPVNGSETAAIPDLTAAGLYLGIEKDALVIEGIVPNSWVALTYPELRRGHRITRLNGRDMTGGLSVAATALRHPIKGIHQLDIRTPGDMVRLQIDIPVAIPSVYGMRMVRPDRPVGYARIGNFQPSTPHELDDAIAALKADGAEAIIFDLRGNHGGSFLAAVETARRLLPAGLIVTTQGQVSDVANQTFSSSTGMSAHNIPIVLLIDAETASAAEVLAAALKDNDRAKVVGLPSFGKGSVQYPMQLMTLDDIDPATGKKINKSGTVRVTIARLIAPTSGPINGTGIAPHFLEADPIRQIEMAVEKAEEMIGQMIPMPTLPVPSVTP